MDTQPANTDPILTSLLEAIISSSSTQIQALRKLRILKEKLLAGLFIKSNEPSAQSITVTIPDQQWLDGLDKRFLSQFDHNNISQLFESAEKEIKKIPVLTIILPIELPEKETAELTNKLRRDYGKNFLIETKLDHNLIAGPALIWKGIYRDYSVKAKIEARKTEILKILKEGIRR